MNRVCTRIYVIVFAFVVTQGFAITLVWFTSTLIKGNISLSVIQCCRSSLQNVDAHVYELHDSSSHSKQTVFSCIMFFELNSLLSVFIFITAVLARNYQLLRQRVWEWHLLFSIPLSEHCCWQGDSLNNSIK